MRIKAVLNYFDARWMMAKQKRSPLTNEHKENISKGIKKSISLGLFTPKTGEETGRKKGYKRTDESNIKLSLATKGKPQNIEKSTGAHENNHKAKWWSFINKANGFILEGKNLSQLIRDNPHMFDDDDVLITKKNDCRASICLRQLMTKKTEKTKPKNSWKGWMVKI
jgi:hypothetical protein